MRVTNPPAGLVHNRLPVVWLARHPSNCVLTIERCGPVCCIVWRTSPYYKAAWIEEAVYADSLEYEVNLASAEAHCALLMDSEAPEQIRPANVRARQREQHETQMAKKGIEKRPRGRPPVTAEHRARVEEERRQRKVERAHQVKAKGAFPWQHNSGLRITVIDEREYGEPLDAGNPFLVQWETDNEVLTVSAHSSMTRAATAALTIFENGPDRKALHLLELEKQAATAGR